MKVCPRCKKKTLQEEEVMNALSRRDNKTYICSECGTMEGLIDAGILSADKVELAFVSKVKTK